MQSIRARLSLNYLLVITLGMTLAGALAWWAVERLYLDSQRENLLVQARRIATALEGTTLPTEPAQPTSRLANERSGDYSTLRRLPRPNAQHRPRREAPSDACGCWAAQ